MNIIVNLLPNTLLTSALLSALLLLISALIYLWAIVFHFRQPESRQTIKMKLTAWMGAITTTIHLLAILFMTEVPLWRVSLSIMLGLAGLSIFAAAIHETNNKGLYLAFSRRVPDAIVSTGIYRWIRHPFYTAYSLTFAMGVVYTANPVVFATALSMVWFYRAAAHDEQKMLESSELAESYEAYRATTDYWQRLFGADKRPS